MISRLSYNRLYKLSLDINGDWDHYRDEFVSRANNKDIRLCKDYIEVEGVVVTDKTNLTSYFNLNNKDIPISSFKELSEDVRGISDFSELDSLLKEKYNYDVPYRYGKNTIRINKKNFKYKREFINYLVSPLVFEDIISNSECYEVIQEGSAVIIDNRCYIASGLSCYDTYREKELPLCGYIYFDRIIWRNINKDFFKEVGGVHLIQGDRNDKCFYPTKIKEGRILKEVLNDA